MPALEENEPIPIEVAITDYETGVQYTLNTTSKEIRASDGTVIRLDEELTAVAVAEFQGTAQADNTAADISNALITPSCDPNDPNNPCEQLRADDSGSQSPLLRRNRRTPSSRMFRWQPRPRNAIPSRPGVRQPVRKTRGGLNKAWGADMPLGSKRPAFASSMQSVSFTCEDIANAVVNEIQAYQSTRTTFLRDLFGAGVSDVVSALSSLGQGFLDVAADRAYVRINLSILGTFWNLKDCRGREVRAGPILRLGTNSGGFGGWVLRCHNEDWSISFDGGQTWSDIIVSVCQYEPA